EAQSFKHTRSEVFREHIRDADEFPQELLAALGPQVQRDAELLDVVVVERAAEVDASPLIHVRPGAAQGVPTPLHHRIFDTNDLRAEGGEKLRRAGARKYPAEVADADVGQSSHRVLLV